MVLMCGHPGGMEVTPAARPDASNPAWPLLHYVNGPEVQFPQLSRIPTARLGFVLTWRIPSWLVKPLEMEEGKPISSWLSCLQPPCGLARSLIQLPVTRLIAAAQTRKGSTYHSHDHDDEQGMATWPSSPTAPQLHSPQYAELQTSVQPFLFPLRAERGWLCAENGGPRQVFPDQIS